GGASGRIAAEVCLSVCDAASEEGGGSGHFGMTVTVPTLRPLYQLEIKLGLAKFAFPKTAGWTITMHVDPMEICRGGTHSRGKVGRTRTALKDLRALGVTVGTHKLSGRVDVVAEHRDGALRLVEVEGESATQREQAM